MATPAQAGSADRRPVEFSAAPASRLWVAACLALGGTILASCLFLGIGEMLFSLKRQVLEAIVQPKVSRAD